MAVRKPALPPTVKERQMAKHIAHIRKSYNRFDRHGGYRDACAELARETGSDVESIYEEWEHVASTRMYDGTVEIEDAEIAALNEVRERYRRAS
jgi:hypothetical protein